jgi:hypothetical protein
LHLGYAAAIEGVGAADLEHSFDPEVTRLLA